MFELVVAAVTRKREAREAAPGGAAEHSLEESADLAQALITNPVFRHKVGAHDLLVYALSSDDGRLCEVTDEQLQHGDIMAASSLIQPAAADAIAATFFEFTNLGTPDETGFRWALALSLEEALCVCPLIPVPDPDAIRNTGS